MIHFVNLNATWDTILLLDSLKLGGVNRAKASGNYPGGKGNNAARTVALLGGKAHLVAFCGKVDLPAAKGFYQKHKVQVDLIPVEGRNRPCVITLDADKDQETVINTPSLLKFTPKDLAKVRAILLKTIKPGELVCFSGSIPEGLKPNTYQTLISDVQRHGGVALLDAYGDALKFGVEAAPFIVKPNADELSEAFGVKAGTREQVLSAASKLLRHGVRAVVVTMGARGAIVVSAKEALFVSPLPQTRGWHSPVGCGDAFFGSLAWAMDKGLDFKDCLRWATAAAWANLHTPGAIFFDKRLAKAQVGQVRVSKISR